MCKHFVFAKLLVKNEFLQPEIHSYRSTKSTEGVLYKILEEILPIPAVLECANGINAYVYPEQK